MNVLVFMYECVSGGGGGVRFGSRQTATTTETPPSRIFNSAFSTASKSRSHADKVTEIMHNFEVEKVV